MSNFNLVFAGSDPGSIGVTNLKQAYKYGKVLRQDNVSASQFNTSHTLDFDNVEYSGKKLILKLSLIVNIQLNI